MARLEAADFKQSKVISEGAQPLGTAEDGIEDTGNEYVGSPNFDFELDPSRLLPGTDMTLLAKAQQDEIFPAGFYTPIGSERDQPFESLKVRNLARSQAQQQRELGIEKIIGSNNLQTPADAGKWPWTAYCIIRCQFPGISGTYQGTGVLIGEDTVLTAAHNLRKNGRNANSVVVLRAGSNMGWVRYWYDPSYPSNTNLPDFDYGIIKTKQKHPFYFGFAAYSGAQLSTARNYNICGFPANPGTTLLWHERPALTPFARSLRYTIDTLPGHSGSPIVDIVEDGNGKKLYLVVGVHSGAGVGAYNEGCRITPDVASQIRNQL